jgi:hypothetical protein
MAINAGRRPDKILDKIVTEADSQARMPIPKFGPVVCWRSVNAARKSYEVFGRIVRVKPIQMKGQMDLRSVIKAMERTASLLIYMLERYGAMVHPTVRRVMSDLSLLIAETGDGLSRGERWESRVSRPKRRRRGQ